MISFVLTLLYHGEVEIIHVKWLIMAIISFQLTKYMGFCLYSSGFFFFFLTRHHTWGILCICTVTCHSACIVVLLTDGHTRNVTSDGYQEPLVSL